MDLLLFMTKTRLSRGKLTHMNPELKAIYYDGIEELRELCYKNKQMGIKNIAEIAKLSIENQRDWHSWLMAKGFKACKNEMELKYQYFNDKEQS